MQAAVLSWILPKLLYHSENGAKDNLSLSQSLLMASSQQDCRASDPQCRFIAQADYTDKIHFLLLLNKPALSIVNLDCLFPVCRQICLLETFLKIAGGFSWPQYDFYNLFNLLYLILAYSNFSLCLQQKWGQGHE